MRRRSFLGTGLTALAATPALAATDTAPAFPNLLANDRFAVDLDPATGAILAIRRPDDPARMSWIGGPDNAPWQPAGSLWGLGFIDLGAETLHRTRWGRPVEMRREADGTAHVRYRAGSLRIDVARRLSGDALHESYRFTNEGTDPVTPNARGKASFALYAPFNDHYTNTEDVLEHRAHAHVWTGGASAWAALFRMGGRGPHLGMVLTEGALEGYSIEDRDQVTLSNTRGTFLLHPAAETLAPGQSLTVGWALFWHQGWADFFTSARRLSPQMVVTDASAWTAMPGERQRLSLTGDLGASPRLTVNGQVVALARKSKDWQADLPPAPPGEREGVLTYRNGLTTRLSLNSVADLDSLIRARVDFITKRQQWQKPGDSWDGAYLVYDNQLDTMVRFDTGSDRRAGRERVGMGVLVARWLRLEKDTDPGIRRSLDRFYAFVNERLQRPDGYVLDGPEGTHQRLYNWPWVMRLHLEMAALGESAALGRFMATLDSYYREGGIDHYPIGLPVTDGLKALMAAGRTAEHDRALSLFRSQGERMLARGVNYPPFEVNFEQSIVAPAALVLLDLHRATGEKRWLEGARPHLALLDLFEGRQPDHRLHGISIRHWDGYWFGKAKMWGDTFPHYWSSLNALAWDMAARATGDDEWRRRAEVTARGNLSLFTPDGRGTAAYIYPLTVNGRPGRMADPYANDQDWALFHALQIREDW